MPLRALFKRCRCSARPELITAAFGFATWLLLAITFGLHLTSSYERHLLKRQAGVQDLILQQLGTLASEMDQRFAQLSWALQNMGGRHQQGPLPPFTAQLEEHLNALSGQEHLYSDIRISPADGTQPQGNSTGPAHLTLALDPSTAKGSLRAALPLYQEDGRYSGSISVRIHLEQLTQSLRPALSNWGGQIHLYLPDGQPLGQLGAKGNPSPRLMPPDQGLKDWLEAGQGYHWDLPSETLEANESALLYRGTSTAPLIYLGLYPLDNRFANWIRDSRWLIALYSGMLALGIVVGYLMVRLTLRLKRLNTQLMHTAQAEERSRKSKEEALIIRDTVLNNTVITIALLINRKFAWVNQQMERMFGYPEKELIGKDTAQLYLSRAAYKRVGEESNRVLASGGSYVTEAQFRRKDGRIIWCLISGKAVSAQDLSRGIIWIIMDISDRKHTELELSKAKRAAENANQAKTLFLTSMSHELRTPLNAILGYAKVLTRQPHKLEEAANAIEHAGEHLLELINDLLDMAKIEADRLVLEPTTFSLELFLRDLAGIIQVRAEERGLNFSAQLSAGVEVAVEADQKRLRQILLNLLGNAIKFTERGGVALRVERLATDEAHHQARFSFCVEDSGIGISIEQRERIFRFFEQGDSPKSAIEPGSGLGLAISRRLAQAMGGDIRLESGTGKGSRFSFELQFPLRDSLAQKHQPPKPTNYHGRRRHILVVDDMPDNRRVLRMYLEMAGFVVSEAGGGNEALALARASRPDLILMDLRMPQVDGIQAAAMIRQADELKSLPIVAVSASLTELDRAGQQQNFASGLHKPVHERQLLDTLGRLLGLKWLQDSPQEAEPKPTHYPTARELRHLCQLIRLGRTSKIREYIHALEQADPASAPFLNQLREQLSHFDLDGLERLIRHQLDKSPQHRA